MLNSITEGIKFRLSSRLEQQAMSPDLYVIVLTHLRTQNPHLKIHSHIALMPDLLSKPLLSQARFFDFVIVNNKRYLASTRTTKHQETLVTVQTSDLGQTWVGQLEYIFCIDQVGIGCHHFGRVRWLVPVTVPQDTIWNQLCVIPVLYDVVLADVHSMGLHVHLWKPDVFIANNEDGPSPLIDLTDISSHVVQSTAAIGSEIFWATIPLPT
jgi:hypothetical protein